MTNAETQLASYFAKYEPAMVKLGKALRAKLRARLPGLFEIVYVYARTGFKEGQDCGDDRRRFRPG
ncbi:MAG: hypothetical protein ACREHF_14055 [Rhizomicrobium sp.]